MRPYEALYRPMTSLRDLDQGRERMEARDVPEVRMSGLLLVSTAAIKLPGLQGRDTPKQAYISRNPIQCLA